MWQSSANTTPRRSPGVDMLLERQYTEKVSLVNRLYLLRAHRASPFPNIRTFDHFSGLSSPWEQGGAYTPNPTYKSTTRGRKPINPLGNCPHMLYHATVLLFMLDSPDGVATLPDAFSARVLASIGKTLAARSGSPLAPRMCCLSQLFGRT